MNILLCTAEELMLTTFEFRFRKNGWKLIVAENAKIALEKTRTMHPDMVVVDLDLPDFEALDIVQFIRKEASTSEMPIMTYGTVENEQLLMESLRLGANDFILTPIKPDELTIRIRRQLLNKNLAGSLQ
ncbi:MAG: response regulator [Saprospiraceae bacterium]|nr:response regulator [Saprospiraceae bacterium]MCF8248950.1 response regulator [Saprospiraceae bacterium]MCF8279161.1 response regulator [Bacteroidales bacterium]MCF8310844.1 response regulator [Saprospiraceae bacterium]MCF8439568.1 response regulator [Saprospiraceae bacterium]